MSAAHHAERAVLGTLLITDATMPMLVIDEGLRAEHFQSPAHQAIYRTMASLNADGSSFDRAIVAARLPSEDARKTLEGIGDAVSVSQLQSYARIVRDEYVGREVERICRDGLSGRAEGSLTPRQLLERLEVQSMAVDSEHGAKRARNIADVMSEQADYLYKVSTGEIKMSGVPSGFVDLDKITGGFRKGNLIIVAARPAAGKSAFVTNVAEHAAVSGAHVLAFSLEMAEAEIAQRLIAAEARVKGDDLRDGKVRDEHWHRIMAAGARMSNYDLIVDDTSSLTITELRARARRAHQRKPLDLVVVDYLQLMHGRPGENRVQAVGEMSRGLKILAKELDVPVVALSQLSRALETRGTDLKSKVPQLSDLRESGSIEQDADVVMFLFRPDYYDPDERPGETDVIVSKHRGGQLGTATLAFMPEYLKFVSLSRRRE